VFLLCAASPAFAQLGAKLSLSGASALSQAAGPWSSTTQTTENGISITQYVNTAGVVFAVSWNGPAKPDLKSLLGTYFKQLPPSATAQVAAASEGDLVVFSSGAMPHFRGYAYLKSQTPSGFQLNK
jgi:hypothetical protein